MPQFSTTRRVRHSAANMFDLVADVESYPQFVPLCRSLAVRKRIPEPKGVEVLVAEMTVAYKFTEPFAPIFVGLGYSYCAPISIPAVAKFGDQFGRNPVGTGPYKFVAWNADDSIVLEKNPEHTWSTTFYKTQQAPQIDRVEFLVIPEDATRLSALSSGEVAIVIGFISSREGSRQPHEPSLTATIGFSTADKGIITVPSEPHFQRRP